MIVSFVPVFSFISNSALTTASSVPQQIQHSTTPKPKKKRTLGRRVLWSVVLFMAAFSGLVAHYNVDKTITDEDRYYIQLLLPGIKEGSAQHMTYEEQVVQIQNIQRSILAHSPKMEGIPEGQPREPKQLYLGHKGLCYDRSRVLEKMCIYLGLQTRHVSLFLREPGVNPLKTLFLHHVPSHAISEVHTAKGWMLVDSNDPWLGLDEQKNPISVRQMMDEYDDKHPVRWLTPVMGAPTSFYSMPCLYVYGLYSRHGRFYPPYTSYIPDYRVGGLLYNFEWLRN